MNCAISFWRTRQDHQKNASIAGNSNSSQNIWGAAKVIVGLKIGDW
jgi:hypothetical protein